MSRAERDARYNASDKGRARHRAYNNSPKGRERNLRHDERRVWINHDEYVLMPTLESARLARARALELKEEFYDRQRYARGRFSDQLERAVSKLEPTYHD